MGDSPENYFRFIEYPINFCVLLALCFYNLKNKRERQAHLNCTCRSLLGITSFPQNPWILAHPLSQGTHPRRRFPPSYIHRPRYLRPYGRLRLLFLPCRRFSANHLPPEICLRTCPQCPDIRLRVTLPGNWKSSCLRWKIFKIELNEPFWNLLKVFLPYVLTEFICILTTIWPLLCSCPSKCRKSLLWQPPTGFFLFWQQMCRANKVHVSSSVYTALS